MYWEAIWMLSAGKRSLVSLWQMDAGGQKRNQLNQLPLIQLKAEGGWKIKRMDRSEICGRGGGEKIGFQKCVPSPLFPQVFSFIYNYSAWCSGSLNESVQLFWVFVLEKSVFHAAHILRNGIDGQHHNKCPRCSLGSISMVFVVVLQEIIQVHSKWLNAH